ANEPKLAGPQVVGTAVGVDQLAVVAAGGRQRDVHAVDGEVPPRRVVLKAGELHPVGGPAVAALGILAEGGDLKLLAVHLGTHDELASGPVPALGVENLVPAAGVGVLVVLAVLGGVLARLRL